MRSCSWSAFSRAVRDGSSHNVVPSINPRCDEVLTLNFINLINVSDIWVIQRGRGLRLLHQASHSILVGPDVNRENLQRYSTPKFGIFCQIHFTHAALTDLGANFVSTESCACFNCHWIIATSANRIASIYFNFSYSLLASSGGSLRSPNSEPAR